MTLTIKSRRPIKQESLQNLVQAALAREREKLLFAIVRTKEELARFEKQYRSSSVRFFRRYQTGKLDDRDDYIDWAGEYQIYLILKERLADLKGLKIDNR